ncbi:hypothetical protein EJ06DRAFT_556885 [Trichodelitschia bisporula]|uniref:Cora-domain-containing protein n=1 Tax=Trichodelitschia bisporula TaxID=703511 RepID=A0A6G1HVK1_9PEZI|nr:hypothetical protein EJ06DRAFT_556885 [Trichodelitschia bisporula]
MPPDVELSGVSAPNGAGISTNPSVELSNRHTSSSAASRSHAAPSRFPAGYILPTLKHRPDIQEYLDETMLWGIPNKTDFKYGFLPNDCPEGSKLQMRGVNDANFDKILSEAVLAFNGLRYFSVLAHAAKEEIRRLHEDMKPSGNDAAQITRWTCTASNLMYLQTQADILRTDLEGVKNRVDNCFDQIYNRMQVDSNATMQRILQSTRRETRTAYRVARSMKEDSVAMKTIAVITMVFLPGTAVTTLLAMPFLNTSHYLSDAQRMWVWVIITVPLTELALLGYS